MTNRKPNLLCQNLLFIKEEISAAMWREILDSENTKKGGSPDLKDLSGKLLLNGDALEYI